MSKSIATDEMDGHGKRVSKMRSVQEVPLAYDTLGKLLKVFIEQAVSDKQAAAEHKAFK